MTDDEVLAEFRAAEALLEGHFILSSGLRSPRYLQCARVLMNPARGALLAEALAAKLPAEIRGQIDAVVSPAMGGVIAGQEVARALRVDAMFLERPTGIFELRRGSRASWLVSPRARGAGHRRHSWARRCGSADRMARPDRRSRSNDRLGRRPRPRRRQPPESRRSPRATRGRS
jgi:hypothetical protein